jgi:hypothetical protein
MSFWSDDFWATDFWAAGFWEGTGIVDNVAIQIPKTKFKEGDSFTATAYFRKDKAAITPGTVYYRVDCITTQKQITDWTELTAGTTVDITITTAIRGDWNRTERKRLTVSADKDTDNEVIGTTHWTVVNLAGLR